MKKSLLEKLNNKRILILGFGKEGQSTFRFLHKHGLLKKTAISDANESLFHTLPNSIKTILPTSYNFGHNYLSGLNHFDIIIKSPGIPLKLIPTNQHQKIQSQTSLMLSLLKKNIIGITGTKGKSTTTSLLYHILTKNKISSMIVGNIGVPFFDIIDQIGHQTTLVAELSSHQLETVKDSPHIAILLNIFQEHLDHYLSYEHYQESKLNITKYQTSEDHLIFNQDNDIITKHTEKLKRVNQWIISSEKIVNSGARIEKNNITFIKNKVQTLELPIKKPMPLIGQHNILNIAAALLASSLKGLDILQAYRSIASFNALSHRYEYLGCSAGIDYINDSISTVPEATIAAIEATEKLGTLLLGGFDRGVDYTFLINYLQLQKRSFNIVCMGQAGQRFFEEYNARNQKNQHRLFVAKTLKEAVDIAKNQTKPGLTCLLSPAAASYDLYENFEERGKDFQKLTVGL